MVAHGGIGPGPEIPAHLVIESLPARTVTSEVAKEIARRAASRPWSGSHPELSRRTELPVADVDDRSAYEVRIPIRLRSGSDPVAVRAQIATIEGVSVEVSCAFPAPLANWKTPFTATGNASDATADPGRPGFLAHRRRGQALRGLQV